jgi:Putative beta-lactamase-inhibitor-like, PepSY-like
MAAKRILARSMVVATVMVAIGSNLWAGEPPTTAAKAPADAAKASSEPKDVAAKDLPPAVQKAIQQNRPKAAIEGITLQDQGGIPYYDVEFKAGGEIEVTGDGTVLNVASAVKMKDLPKEVAAVFQKASTGARIETLLKSEVRAEIMANGDKSSLMKLEAPKYVYEAELEKGTQVGEIVVTEDGTIVEDLHWEEAAPEVPVKKD